MTEAIFSERFGFAPKPDPQAYDYLPGWIREAITNEIEYFVNKDSLLGMPRLDLYPLFRPYIWQVLDRRPPGSPAGGPFAYYIPQVLAQCSWWQFYDILEQMCKLIDQKLYRSNLEEFSQMINGILARDGIPWELEQGRVTRVFNPQIAAVIQQVPTLLADPRFKGPDQQFAKAVEHLNKRPAPDVENCVKDAVGAVEAVANIIAGTQGIQLNKLLERGPFREGIHSTIRESVEKIYAYRGAAPGVSHGQVGHSIVGLAEATWVLATSAATILYLISKFGKPTS